ncbi:hypothetical protein Ahy_B08g092821 [Arachis hypogaea]|uniref:SWIM-type domain-containing protein n=1 Tax=Arachis hypogaea TaxID=3818 RepID=A0A444Y4W2_ARAHY|nr:hypothetical protein Ahy_B08g092821 [Arachis hypogaea]
MDNYTNNNCEVFNAKVKKMREKSIITMLEEVRCYVMWIMARNKKALVGYSGRLAPTQQSRLEREKRESNKWRPLPTRDDAGNVYEVQCLPMKVSVDLRKGTCSCKLWQLTGLPCRHTCAALAHQNKRPEEYAHNWLTMGAYNAAYQTSMRPVPSQEFWEHLDTLPILPPRYKKPIRRPSTKRDKRNDAPKDKSDPHRTKRRIGTIICKYCLQAGHNKRSCKKRKEAMGEGSAAPQVPASDEDEDMLAEMYYEETLEAAEAEAAATEVGNVSTAGQPAQQAHSPRLQQPLEQPRNNLKGEVSSDPPRSAHTPQASATSPNNPSTTPSTHNSQTTPNPLQGASAGTTTRFVQLMPTTGAAASSRGRGTAVRGMGEGRGRGRRGASSGAKNGVSSGSSNSTPMS